MSLAGQGGTDLRITVGNVLDALTELFGVLEAEELRCQNRKLMEVFQSVMPPLRRIRQDLDWISDDVEYRKARLVLSGEQLEALRTIHHRSGDVRRWLATIEAGFVDSDTEPDMALPWLELQHAAEILKKTVQAGPTNKSKRSTVGEKVQTSDAGTMPKQRATKRDAKPTPWVTVSEAASITGADKGVISRAVNSNELKGQGKGRQRRICPADLSRWQLARAKKPEAQESDKSVKKKLKQASE